MLSLRVDDRELRKAFRKLQDRQIPYAIANALNIVAEHARADIVAAETQAFDRPTPYTLRAFYVAKAGPRRLTATVAIRDFAASKTPAWKPLNAEAEGGPRRMKALELRLAALSGGQYILPGRGARLDQYGNISRGQIAQVLSGISSDTELPSADATTKRLKRKGLIARGAKSSYFIARSKTGSRRPLGVYQLIGPGHVEPVLIFTPKVPTYKTRLDPERIVLQAVNRYGASAIEQALAHELANTK